jgi:hypothetical protein
LACQVDQSGDFTILCGIVQRKWAIVRWVDDTPGIVHTHGITELIGGLMVGPVADPKMIEYADTMNSSRSVSIGGNPPVVTDRGHTGRGANVLSDTLFLSGRGGPRGAPA